ncbi:DNA-binding CsgD family transcriptional regulator/tetratricopeptide (TPR) repeat protein [Actinoplanes tereljensis]|uniref:LuxR family transcriptional regulator n=1 Tax=Paractinoplanes tereljensis TaxID=571912 RepID=A0A919NQJ9_9ACTN|nr:LuxR family transcriptional regulator [Actinoplanes tereljensis]GIF23230.1 LuxR family transcriptional regulator [Actinoplanes tereljensis]
MIDTSPAVSAARFVGRDRELAALRGALARPPAIVLVEGEAGIGKSRLLREWLAAPERPSALVSVCPPLRESLTLGPIVDAFLGVERPLLSDLAGALRPLFPEWAADLPPALPPLDDAKAARHRLFRALDELLRALRVEVLVLEDAHWADEVTLEFLLFVISRQQSDGPSLVISYRPEEVGDGSLLLRLTSRLPAGVTQLRIALAPLRPDDTAALVSSMLDGNPISQEFTAFLHDRTGGVPLALEESVRLMFDRADLVFRDGQWVRLKLRELRVPPTVRDSTRERVSRLSPAAQQALRAAATLAVPSSVATIAMTADLSPDACRGAIAEAAAAGVLDGDDRGRWRFRHVLACIAVYEAIPLTDRRQFHLLAGRALEQLHPPPVARLAHHFREAGEPQSWARYAEQGAELAMASGDHTKAVELLVDLLSRAVLPPVDRARVARMAGVAALRRREPVDALYHRVIRTLRSVLDTPGLSARQQAEIRNPLGRLLITGGEAQAALGELEQAVANLDHDPVEAARAMTYLGWAYAGPWPASTHRRWLDRAAELTAQIDSPAQRLNLAGNRAAALLMLGEEEAWDLVAGLPVDGPTTAERLDLARIHVNVGTGALIWGRYADAEEHLAVAMRLAEAEQASRLQHNVRLEQANLAWNTGRWEGLAETSAELADADRDRPAHYLGSIRLAARLAAAAGRRRVAEEQFRLVLEESARLGAADDTMEAAAALARLWLTDGNSARALQITDEPMETVRRKGIWIWATDLVPARVEALLAAGDPSAAKRLVDQFARGLRGRTAPAPRAALAVCRAFLQGTATAYDRAARAWSALPRPYDAMRARERQAAALLAAGHLEEGRELLAAQYEQLFRLGARGDADRVAQRLREHGADVPRLWRGGRRGYGDQLSPRELDVVQLVVAGKTNREISRILSKSPATVDQQLRAAMRKLNVNSRTALAVKAVEAGVFADEL